MENESDYNESAIESINIFDPDIAYLYSEAMAEYDYLLKSEYGYFLYEKLSNQSEWKKHIRNLLLSPSLPPVLWSQKVNGLRVPVVDKKIPAIQSRTEFYYTIGPEICNMLFYANTILAPYFAEKINNDFIESWPKDDPFLKKFVGIAEFFSQRLPKIEENIENLLSARLREIPGCKTLAVFLQLGYGQYSIKGVVNFLKYVKKCQLPRHEKMAIVLNKYLKETHKDELLEVINEVKMDYLIYCTDNCQIKAYLARNSSNEIPINEKNEIPINKLYPIIGLVLQDWKKELLECFIKNTHAPLLVFPEAYYTLSSGDKKVKTVGRYLPKSIPDAEFKKLIAEKLVMIKGVTL